MRNWSGLSIAGYFLGSALEGSGPLRAGGIL